MRSEHNKVKRHLTHEEVCERLRQTVADGGPIKRESLEHLAWNHGSKHPVATVDGMIEEDTLVKYGDRRGSRWGLKGHPGLARPEKRKVVKVLR